jgi:hypothetical protein
MPQWYVGVSIRASEPGTDSVLDCFEAFRPHDDEQCIWVDQDDRTLLHVTTEIPATDSDAALDAGRDMAQEAIAALGSAAHAVDVETEDVDDESGAYFLWRHTGHDH